MVSGRITFFFRDSVLSQSYSYFDSDASKQIPISAIHYPVRTRSGSRFGPERVAGATPRDAESGEKLEDELNFTSDPDRVRRCMTQGEVRWHALGATVSRKYDPHCECPLWMFAHLNHDRLFDPI